MMRGRWTVAAVMALALGACGDDAAKQPVTGADADAAEDVADTASGDDTSAGDDTAVAEDTAAPDDTLGPLEAPTVLTLIDQRVVTLSGGVSAPITVNVPAGVVSVTLSVLGDVDGLYGVGSWQGEGDRVLVTDGWMDGDDGALGLCLSCPNRIALSEGDFAAIAPNNPAATVESGPYTFTAVGHRPKEVTQSMQGQCGDSICTLLDQFQCPKDCAALPIDGDVVVSVHAKLAPEAAVPETGVLDLNFHFTGARGWSAASAPTDADFQAIVDAMRTLYAQVGVSLGELTYRDIDPSFATIESVQGADSDLMQLFATSEGNASNAVNLFFVDEISAGSFGGFGVILGVSGGIPGPPLTQGTWRSGVAISVQEVEGAPAGIDTTMAHEVGHFLGLFHTSEQNFGFGDQVHDPLPDTPENDATYLMFNTGAGSILSPWQGRVMRSNPWVRHLEEVTR